MKSVFRGSEFQSSKIPEELSESLPFNPTNFSKGEGQVAEGMKRIYREDPPKGGRRIVLLTSVLSLLSASLLLLSAVVWNGSVRVISAPARTVAVVGSRRLSGETDEDSPPFQCHDTTRSGRCTQYLSSFINETTDARDECQNINDAFSAANCANAIIFPEEGIPDSREADNGTVVDDDFMIDDFVVNLECCSDIRKCYDAHCTQETGIHSMQLLGVTLVLLVCSIIKALLKRFDIHWLPDACAFIIVGAVVSGFQRIFDSRALQRNLTFDQDFFLQILLPPIIFQAALSIDKRAFRRDFFPILAFASFGTAFSAIAIGYMVFKVSSWGSGTSLPLLESLLFGALISSIDPVATLGILSGVGVSQTDTLYTLIFGESLLNDGVAIVLFDTLKEHLGQSSELDSDAYRSIFGHFVAVLFGSIGVGVVCGVVCVLYFWMLRGRQTAVSEVATFFCWALIPYYVADGFGCSGIIAIMIMGFILDYFVIGGFESEDVSWMEHLARRTGDRNGGLDTNFENQDRWTRFKAAICQAFNGRGHILSRSRHHVGFVAHVIAALMETAIFSYLGLFLFTGNIWHFRLNVTAVVGCVLSRTIMVIGLSFFINLCVFLDVENTLARYIRVVTRVIGGVGITDDNGAADDTERIYLDKQTQIILLLSGVRGAVSFALVENIPVYDAVTKVGSHYKAELKAMTSSSIVFTIFVFGALTFFMVQQRSETPRRISNTMTNHLLSEALDSGDLTLEGEDTSEIGSMEVENNRFRRPSASENPAERYRIISEADD